MPNDPNKTLNPLMDFRPPYLPPLNFYIEIIMTNKLLVIALNRIRIFINPCKQILVFPILRYGWKNGFDLLQSWLR